MKRRKVYRVTAWSRLSLDQQVWRYFIAGAPTFNKAMGRAREKAHADGRPFVQIRVLAELLHADGRTVKSREGWNF